MGQEQSTSAADDDDDEFFDAVEYKEIKPAWYEYERKCVYTFLVLRLLYLVVVGPMIYGLFLWVPGPVWSILLWLAFAGMLAFPHYVRSYLWFVPLLWCNIEPAVEAATYALDASTGKFIPEMIAKPESREAARDAFELHQDTMW